ncbi:MAG: DUF92 domain-containing protein [Anaerolineae bacterium]|nr:DUF92 domain-containing protein [Anaerolineae bacterium]
MQLTIQFGIGLLISTGIGWVAYQKGSLSKSGMVGAMLTGTLIFGCGGWIWGALLITFFILSSLLSKYKENIKETLAEKFAKGSRRDIWQTFANGGAGALLALVYGFHPHPVWFLAFMGAMATVNADTWATELGVLSQHPPRLITTGQPVEVGTSGGISRMGTLATLAGGLAIGIAALFFILIDSGFGGRGIVTDGDMYTQVFLLPLLAALSGLTGSLCDSFLGATVQAIYYSPVRKKETEKVIDPDGTPNQHLRGWRWLNNDWVNFISSLVGAGSSVLLGNIF